MRCLCAASSAMNMALCAQPAYGPKRCVKAACTSPCTFLVSALPLRLGRYQRVAICAHATAGGNLAKLARRSPCVRAGGAVSCATCAPATRACRRGWPRACPERRGTRTPPPWGPRLWPEVHTRGTPVTHRNNPVAGPPQPPMDSPVTGRAARLTWQLLQAGGRLRVRRLPQAHEPGLPAALLVPQRRRCAHDELGAVAKPRHPQRLLAGVRRQLLQGGEGVEGAQVPRRAASRGRGRRASSLVVVVAGGGCGNGARGGGAAALPAARLAAAGWLRRSVWWGRVVVRGAGGLGGVLRLGGRRGWLPPRRRRGAAGAAGALGCGASGGGRLLVLWRRGRRGVGGGVAGAVAAGEGLPGRQRERGRVEGERGREGRAVGLAEPLHHAVDARDVVVGAADEGEEALERGLAQHARPCSRAHSNHAKQSRALERTKRWQRWRRQGDARVAPPSSHTWDVGAQVRVALAGGPPAHAQLPQADALDASRAAGVWWGGVRLGRAQRAAGTGAAPHGSGSPALKHEFSVTGGPTRLTGCPHLADDAAPAADTGAAGAELLAVLAGRLKKSLTAASSSSGRASPARASTM